MTHRATTAGTLPAVVVLGPSSPMPDSPPGRSRVRDRAKRLPFEVPGGYSGKWRSEVTLVCVSRAWFGTSSTVASRRITGHGRLPSSTAFRVHADRAAGGHRDHRRADRTAAARRAG